MIRPPCHSVLLRSFGIRPQFTARHYATARHKQSTIDFNNLTTDEQLEHLNKLAVSAENNPGVDIWAASADLLDLHVPEPVIRTGVGKVPATTRVRNLFQNQLNHFKNAFSMYRIAKNHSFPGVHTPRAFSFNLFKSRSASDKAWVSPLRDIAATTYTRVNEALAENDARTLKKLTNSGYFVHLQSLLKTRTPGNRYVWKIHSEVEPAKVVSIRAIDGHLGRGTPKLGNRLVVQALIRFDTLQTLEVYSKRGELISPTNASEPRRVTEYLVFEKRMWYDIPWMIKQQLFETSA